MKVYFCRDMNGTCTVWDATSEKPILDTELEDDVRWDSSFNKCVLLADEGCIDADNDVFEMFGKGFHGVKKGRYKLLDLEPMIEEKNTVKDLIGFKQVYYDCDHSDYVKIVEVLVEHEKYIMVRLADDDVGLIYKKTKAFISFDKECAWYAE